MENDGIMAWEYLEGAKRGTQEERDAAFRLLKRYAKDDEDLAMLASAVLEMEFQA